MTKWRCMLTSLTLVILGVLSARAQTVVPSSQTPSQDPKDWLRQAFDDAHQRGTDPSIEFTDNKIFSDQELFAEMEELLEVKRCRSLSLSARSSGDKCGDQYDFDKLQNDLVRLRAFLGTQGYLQANIGGLKMEDSGRGLKVVVSIEAGRRYRVGQIKVIGAEFFSAEQIIQLTGFRPGEIASAENIRKGIYEEIKRAYGDQGYIQASADLEPEFKDDPFRPQEGVVNFTIRVDEGKAFSIRSIKFVGLVQADFQMLRDQLLIQEGGVYSKRLMEESLANINRLGLVEEIWEKNVRTSVYGQTSQVDIEIHVREKETP